MTTYAIGDIQGCAKSFDQLLESIAFDETRDRLWLTGDLVNRGPDSLQVLRRVASLQDCATVVLGNHDLHLLAIAAGVRPPSPADTFQDVLEAADRQPLIDWLRRQPLLHYDSAAACVLVHAGLPPGWSLQEALAHGAEVSERLAGPGWRDALQTLYGDEPRTWSAALKPQDRHRYTINALTRMRYCDANGNLDFTHKGPPGSQPPALKPWYELRARDGVHIVFGHWASLGLARIPHQDSTAAAAGPLAMAGRTPASRIDRVSSTRPSVSFRPFAPPLRRLDTFAANIGETPWLVLGPGFTCVDNGCVWGRSLTAVPLDPPGAPISVPCMEGRRENV